MTLHAFNSNDDDFDYAFLPPTTDPSECGKFYSTLDFSALTAATDSKVFGTEYVEGEHGPDAIEAINRTYFPTSYDFGFKFLLGFSFPGDQWAASASWMWYHSNQSTSRSDGGFGSSKRGGTFFVPGIDGLALVSDITFPTRSKGKWSLTFNQFDFLASRNFLVGPAFTINPSFGVRVLGLKEEVKIDSVFTSEPPFDFILGNFKSDFWSAGPCIGVDCSVDLGFGLAGFLETKGALLLANQHNKHHLNAPAALLPFDLDDVSFKNDPIGLKGAVDFAVGLEWRMPVTCNLHFFFVRVAFENHIVFRATNYPSINVDSTHLPFYSDQPNDLALYGYSISFGFKI
jgi:hypothetical protein